MNSGFLGRGWAFPPHLNDRDRVSMVDADTDIKQAIYIIINTAPGERVMHPDFGCNIHDMIFWPANDQTAAIIERQVTEALTRWEPRIRLHEVRAVPGATEVGQMLINIVYEIKQTHDKRSMVYPFYLTPA
ncbi:MAG: baseplate protein [Anaerolineaceae bacterium]|nr:baseplate protein [Anaerolineaceae bacterium]